MTPAAKVIVAGAGDLICSDIRVNDVAIRTLRCVSVGGKLPHSSYQYLCEENNMLNSTYG